MSRARGPLYTIGHSTHPLEDFIEILQGYSIAHLVDIRTVARSRYNPQFNEETLPGALGEAQIRYTHAVALGGLRPRSKTVAPEVNGAWELASFHNYADYAEGEIFRRALDDLIEQAGSAPTVIMCAEAVWWRCHRRIVSDHVLARHVGVVHIFGATKAEPATMTPFALVSRGPHVTYPATSAPISAEMR